MSGPCLCGDPYCRRCGNPAAAAWADFSVEVSESVISALEQQGREMTPENVIDATLDYLLRNPHMAEKLLPPPPDDDGYIVVEEV